MEQEFRFCTSADGTRIAYTLLGDGPPLVFAGTWGRRLEQEWKHPDSRTALQQLAAGRRFVQYDTRGVGASQREVDEVSLDSLIADLSAVVDDDGLDKFDLFASGEASAAAVGYAAEHPERVSRLVLWATYTCGAEAFRLEAVRGLMGLIGEDWNMAVRTIASSVFPSGPVELQSWYRKATRESMSPEVAAKYLDNYVTIDLRPHLPRVQAPTLVLHPRDDRNAPLASGRAAATLIPGSRFVPLEGDTSHPLFSDGAWISTVTQFLDEGREDRAVARTAPTGAGRDVHTILFTDMASSTSLTQQLGDAKAQEVRRNHNDIVRSALSANSGSEIKHTGDGIMASFATASAALDAAIAIQRGVAEHKEANPDSPLAVYVGLNAGEPIAEDDDLFGTSINLAARICDHAEPGQILASDVVRQLAAGKDFLFADLGETALRGFEDPVKLWELRWEANS